MEGRNSGLQLLEEEPNDFVFMHW